MKTGIQINQDQTFDTFTLSKSNQFAYSMVYTILKFPFVQFTPIYLYGNKKVGKTHLLNAVANALKKDKITFTTGSTFSSDFLSARKQKELYSFREHYRENTDILIIDDIQTLFKDEIIETELLHTINTLYTLRKSILVSGNIKPQALSIGCEKLRSRLQLGIVSEIKKRRRFFLVDTWWPFPKCNLN